MNRAWMALVGVGVLIMVLVSGWELFLIFSGTESEFQLNLVPIEDSLFGDVEEHFLSAPEYEEFVQLEDEEFYQESSL